MIVDEYRSGATIIRFDDRNIEPNEEKEILDTLLSLIMKKFSESN